MCEENVHVNMTIETAPRPRYHVAANKTIYSGADFDSIEEATGEATRLAIEGYDIVSIRDNHSDSNAGW